MSTEYHEIIPTSIMMINHLFHHPFNNWIKSREINKNCYNPLPFQKVTWFDTYLIKVEILSPNQFNDPFHLICCTDIILKIAHYHVLSGRFDSLSLCPIIDPIRMCSRFPFYLFYIEIYETLGGNVCQLILLWINGARQM